MAANKAVISWKGDYGNPEGHYGKTKVVDVIGDTELGVLITALAAHTDCNAAKRSFFTQTGMTDTAPGADVSVDKKAIIYMRDPDDLSVHSLTLPGIKDTSTEKVPQGRRVTAAALSAIVTAVNTATGKSYAGLYGKVEEPA